MNELLAALAGAFAGVIVGTILFTTPQKPKDNAEEYDQLIENAKAEWELEQRLEGIETRLEKAEAYKHFHLGQGGPQ